MRMLSALSSSNRTESSHDGVAAWQHGALSVTLTDDTLHLPGDAYDLRLACLEMRHHRIP